MQQLFQNKAWLSPVEKPEKALQQFIYDNGKELFPQYSFIAQEFPLIGNVRSLGNNGRIDILAYNPATQRFVFFELKKNYDKNIGHQAADYRHYIQKNFLNVYVDALQKYKAPLPDKAKVNDKEVEMVLIAKGFSSVLLEQAENESLVTLIEYNWFENDLVLFDYIYDDDVPEPIIGKEPSKEWVDKVAEKGWTANVKSTKDANFRRAVADIPFTKENIDRLKKLVEKVPSKGRRAILKLCEDFYQSLCSYIGEHEK